MNAGHREEPRRATPLEAARTIFWGFFGVRRKDDHHRDTAQLTPLQIIIAGLIGAALFVLTLVGVVSLVTRQ
jgi:hypothetical protein